MKDTQVMVEYEARPQCVSPSPCLLLYIYYADTAFASAPVFYVLSTLNSYGKLPEDMRDCSHVCVSALSPCFVHFMLDCWFNLFDQADILSI